MPAIQRAQTAARMGAMGVISPFSRLKTNARAVESVDGKSVFGLFKAQLPMKLAHRLQ